MKMKTVRNTFFFAVAIFLTAASLPLFADDDADRKTAADMNRHGFELFRLLSEKDSKENAFISPYSINSAFGLVYCGAKDRTAEEIRSTLGLPADPEKCGEFFHAVSQEYAANKTVEVLVSNSVWLKGKMHLHEEQADGGSHPSIPDNRNGHPDDVGWDRRCG